MRIAVDVMGSDHGPGPVVAGACDALRAIGPPLAIDLVGREDEIRAELKRLEAPPAGDRLRVVGASEVVEMGESPTSALRRKRDSSIRRAAELVASGEADGLVSAGSTGAVAATTAILVGLIEGVDRPAIGAVLPTPRGQALLIDAGANLDCRPEWLLQFAIMGRIYSEVVLGTGRPRVGLLSVGEEDSKGNELTREAHALLRRADVGFVGNVDGKDLFSGRVDVVVCDGFVGNALLKASEAMPSVLAEVFRDELKGSWAARLGLLLAGPALRRIWHRLDWETYGGAPLLGVDAACIICHGRSGAKAIRSAVRVAHDFVAGQVCRRIAERLKGVA
jgi:glycerol-3-phosphate acyltransferase PlsX